MKKASLDFWKYINENYDEEIVEEYVECNEIDVSKMNKKGLSPLKEDEMRTLFYALTNLYMDVSGDDSYSDVFDLLQIITDLDDRKIAELLDFDEDEIEELIGSEETPDNTESDWKYTELENGTLRLDNYIGSDKEIIVPKAIKEKTVSEIGEGALDAEGGSAFEARKLPRGQKKVRSKIKKIILPDTIEKIDKEAFLWCPAEEIQLSDNITEICEGAFKNCKGLKTINMPKSLKIIGKEAFSGIHCAPVWMFPDGLEQICDGAFMYSSIKEAHIPESVSVIEDYAFSNAAFFDSDDTITIFGKKGSEAERFAEDNKLNFCEE